MSESLSVYWGLFLNACAPLELSLNYCSHNCSFCFANLNSPDRTADVAQVMGLLSSYQSKNTFAAKLLRDRYPVTFSNHVDPFSESNWRLSLPLIDALNDQGIPIVFQTKGGKGSKEAMKSTPPSVWYISIETLDPEVSRRVASGAPLPKERLQLIEDLRHHGHRVVVGINPAVEDWIGDPDELCRQLKSAGCEATWIQPLHLSNNQIKNLGDRERAALGESVLSKARKMRRDESNMRIYHACREASMNHGMDTYDLGQPQRSDFFKPYKETYKKTFPVLQDFVNHCWDKGYGENEPIYFKDFRDFFLPYLPEGVFPLRNHIGAVQFQHFWKEWDEKIPKNMTYEALLQWCWEVNSIIYNPVNSHAFCWAAKKVDSFNPETHFSPIDPMTKIQKGKEDDIWELYTDDGGLPILLFRPSTEKYMCGEWDAWQMCYITFR